MKRFSLLLVCAILISLVSFHAFGQTTTVYDGPSTTIDIVWWSDTDFFYANWSSANWSSAPVTDYKLYHVELQRKIVSGDSDVSASGSPPESSLSPFGSAFFTGAPGYKQYNFSGTATLRLLSLGGVELSGAIVSGLEVRCDDSATTVAQIRNSTAEKQASDSEVLVTLADDTLCIKRVFLEGQSSPATGRVLMDAMLFLPGL